MPAVPPQLPPGAPSRFRATVHGLAFAGRDRHLDDLHRGDRLLLIPDPPGQDEPGVWVHLRSGEPLGHLPPEIAHWLWPWLSRGGSAATHALTVHGDEVPSWRRLVVQVRCGEG